MPLPSLSALAIHAGLCGLILLGLGLNVVRVRKRVGVWMGDGGQPELIRAMRGQANFIEFVPLTLILIGLCALLGAGAWAAHLLGGALVAGRALHGWHFAQTDAPAWQRGLGTALSLLALIGSSIGALALGLSAV